MLAKPEHAVHRKRHLATCMLSTVSCIRQIVTSLSASRDELLLGENLGEHGWFFGHSRHEKPPVGGHVKE
jgi:hypothetical protein